MVPFGLAQAPAYFQALINKVLKGLHKFAVVYFDDIIIFNKTEEEHLEHLRIIFQRLKEASLMLEWSKCDFVKKQIQYLGHLISSNGIQPLPKKLDTIKKMPALQSPKEVKQFLGLAGYYCKFVCQAHKEGCIVQMDQGMSSMFWTVEGSTLHAPHIMVSWSREAQCAFHRC